MLGETTSSPPKRRRASAKGSRASSKTSTRGTLAVEGAGRHPLLRRKRARQAHRRSGQEAAHGALPQRPGGDRPPPLCARLHRPASSPCCTLFVTTLTMVAHDNIKCILPGYTHLRRRSPSTSRSTSTPIRRSSCDDMERLEGLQEARQRHAPRQRGACGHLLPHRPRDHEKAPEVRRHLQLLHRTPFPTATSWRNTSSASPGSCCTFPAFRRHHPLHVGRIRLLGDFRRLLHGLFHHAPEEEPRYPRTHPRQVRAGHRRSHGLPRDAQIAPACL